MDDILCCSLEIDIFVWTTPLREVGEISWKKPDRMRQKQ